MSSHLYADIKGNSLSPATEFTLPMSFVIQFYAWNYFNINNLTKNDDN